MNEIPHFAALPEDVRESANRYALEWFNEDSEPAEDRPSLGYMFARAIMAERERCACIDPASDIEEEVDAYSGGYMEGFADCLVRYRAGILVDTRRLSGVLGAHGETLRQIITKETVK